MSARERILDTFESILNTDGERAATLDAVAAKAGVSKGGLLYHFPNREALITGLAEVARTQPEAWRRVLSRHNEALLGAALCDERLFELLANDVRVPTSQGDMLIRGLRSASGTLHVMLGSQGGFEDMLFRALRVPVARGDRYAVVPFLRKWVAARGGVLIELGTERGNRELFTPARLPPEELAWLEKKLGTGETVVAARFSPAELPLVAVPVAVGRNRLISLS